MSLTVVVYDALIGDPSTSARAFSDKLIESMDSYDHSVSVDGGYKDMRISFGGTAAEIQFWYEQGLGRKVETRSPNGTTIWEGFINEISIQLSGLSMSVGPVLDMANRVYVEYTKQRYVADGISWGGEPVITDAGNDTDSQDKYGIMVEYISGGEGEEPEMLTLRNAHLADRAQPFVSQAQIATLGGSAASVSLSCLGYHALLGKYTYDNGATGTYDISEKIQAIISADPSTRFSSDYSSIEDNALEVPKVEEGHKTAATILKELVSYGNSSDQRHILGVYSNQRVKYGPIEELASYEYSVTSSAAQIKDMATNTIVRPWGLLPGKWLIVSGLTTSQTPIGDITVMRSSPAAMYIEEVSFSAPYSVSIKSGPTATFSQKLSRLGVGLQ